ncbi:hypothetical protein BSKO_13997 [Bryopsis sp. KO-2023]|nr:hypothetical protein BSKO_13997 [Bryopsis sp. KO-2023]
MLFFISQPKEIPMYSTLHIGASVIFHLNTLTCLNCTLWFFKRDRIESRGSRGAFDRYMAFSVAVQFGKDSHKIEIGNDAAVGELQSILEDRLGIIARKQKLIHKGKVLQADVTFAQAKIKNGGKILLLSSSGVETRGKSALEVSHKERLAAAKARADKILQEKSKLPSKTSTTIVSPTSLKDQVKIWTQLKLISLRGRELLTVPSEAFLTGSSVEGCDISVNKISALPDEFSVLNSLKMFKATHNNLTSKGLGQGLFKLTSLVRLHLSDNSIECMPDEISSFANLRILSLSNNLLEVLPAAVSHLTNLRDLDVSHNNLKELPSEMSKCSSLVRLSVKRNLVSQIPDTFSELKNLRIFNLDENRVKEVPSEVLKNCVSLGMLSLHDNPITMEQFRETQNFQIYEARRKHNFDKKIDMDVMDDGGFDEGVDFVSFEKK